MRVLADVNLEEIKVAEGTTIYTYNALNQLVTETSPEGNIVYTYDANGNLLNKAGAGTAAAYTYDMYNRLIRYTEGEKKESYTYDAEGVRRSKKNDTENIIFVSDTTGSLSQTLIETDGNGNLIAAYTKADTLLSQTRDDEISYYLYDGHGDVRALLNEAGRITDKYRYNAYGELLEQTRDTENHYLYTGEYYDGISNLYYLRARYMNSSTGTFISMDTYEGSIYDPDTLHKYLYANGNPVTYSDPSGHSPIGEFVASTICTIMNNAYEINLMGVLSGLTNAAVTGLLGGSDMDITKSFIEGYLFGVAIGIGTVLIAAAVTDVLVLAKFYAVTATAGSALSVGAAIYAIINHNKRAAIVYGVLAVLSIFNMARAYNYYCEVWLIGEKGVAAFSTAEFSTAKGMGKSGKNSSNPFYKQGGGSNLDDFMTPHAQKHAYNPNVKSTKNKTQFGENIDVAKLREDTMLHPDKVIYDSEHNMIKYVKEYDFNISTADTPTGSHRVFINLAPKAGKTNRNSQFPYYGGDK